MKPFGLGGVLKRRGRAHVILPTREHRNEQSVFSRQTASTHRHERNSCGESDLQTRLFAVNGDRTRVHGHSLTQHRDE